MKLLNKLEKKFGKLAIKNLMLYIVFANCISFILGLFEPEFIGNLTLVPSKVLEGEVWRVITFLFIPPIMPYSIRSIFFIIFALYFYYLIGSSLEHVWGTFKFNAYYFIGYIGIVIVSFVTKLPMDNTYLNLSLFFAFARLFPDFRILLFFIIPIKIKYLAWFNWAIFILSIILPWSTMSTRMAAIIGIINYLIFFGKDILLKRKTATVSYTRKKVYQEKIKTKKTHFHKCSVCGRTELDDPNLEFRYCSKCDGHVEYCMEHLFTHEHIKK